jgi:hypothetical protein
MKRTRLTALVALSSVAALSASCVQEQASVFISGVLPVRPPQCSAVAGGNVYQGIGTLDLGDTGELANDYTIALEVATNLPSTFTTQDLTQNRTRAPNYPNYGGADANVIFFEGVEVYFEDEDRAPIPQLPSDGATRISAVGGTVYNEQTTLNSQAAIFAPLLTSLEAQRLANIGLTAPLVDNPEARARIVARARILGRTTGGASVRSPLFSFPLEICRGCLYALGADANGTCPPGTTLTPQQFCFEGQDLPVAICQ